MRTRIPSPRRTRLRLAGTLAVAGVVGALVLPAAAAQATRLPEDRSTPPPNVTFPVALSANPVDARSYVAGRHLGTEINAACGTVVRAATPGTVRVRTDAKWAGKAW